MKVNEICVPCSLDEYCVTLKVLISTWRQKEVCHLQLIINARMQMARRAAIAHKVKERHSGTSHDHADGSVVDDDATAMSMNSALTDIILG